MSHNNFIRGSAAVLLLFIASVVIAIGSGVAPAAYNLIQNEGTNLSRFNVLNFTGAGVDCTNGTGKTVCDVPGGGGGGYDTIENETVALTQRSVVNFTGAGIDCVDDAMNTRTDCTVAGGASGNVSTFGVYPTFPGSPSTGDTFYPSNSPHMFAYDGAAWIPYNMGPAFIPLQTWDPSTWTLTNGGCITLTQPDVDPVINISSACSAADNLHLWEKAVLTAPYTATVDVSGMVANGAVVDNWGLAIKDSVGGRLISLMVINTRQSPAVAAGDILKCSWTSETSIAACTNLTYQNTRGANAGMWLRIASDGTTRTFSFSTNGVDYLSVTEAIAGSWITAAEDVLGIGNYTANTATRGSARIDHYSLTNP